MSLKSFFKKLTGSPVVQSVEQFALNELDKGIQAAKKTSVGAAVASAVMAAEQSGKGPVEKAAQVLAIVAPEVEKYLLQGGAKAATADVEQFAKMLIESTLADIKQTQAVLIARAFLSILGIK